LFSKRIPAQLDKVTPGGRGQPPLRASELTALVCPCAPPSQMVRRGAGGPDAEVNCGCRPLPLGGVTYLVTASRDDVSDARNPASRGRMLLGHHARTGIGRRDPRRAPAEPSNEAI
jgi:hypothetical protein